MLFDIENQVIKEHIREAEFGIERESLRVNADGTLAQTPHPFPEHKNIDRDFCENQVELIGDVFTDPEELNEQLLQLQRQLNTELKKRNELLWAFSNPPKISGEDEIPVAEYHGILQNKSLYRRYLAAKYGKKKMLFSGIHLNFSFSESLLKAAFAASGATDFSEFKNDLYLRLSKRLTQYAWLVVFLTAASPVADKTIGTDSNIYSSIRCSERGYWNFFTPILDYTSLKKYVGSIERYIEDGNLKSVSELYYPVRLKPRGENSLETLVEKGINHVELRVIDVNPLSPTGVLTKDIRFIHLLMLYLASLPEFDFNDTRQFEAIRDIKTAAVFRNAEIRQKAVQTLTEIQSFTWKNFPEYSHIVEYQIEKLTPGNSYAEIVSRRFSEDYMKKGLALAEEYQRSVGCV